MYFEFILIGILGTAVIGAAQRRSWAMWVRAVVIAGLLAGGAAVYHFAHPPALGAGAWFSSPAQSLVLPLHRQHGARAVSSSYENRKSPGQIAYEQDVGRCPTYHDGQSRREWRELAAWARLTWEQNPTAREYAR